MLFIISQDHAFIIGFGCTLAMNLHNIHGPGSVNIPRLTDSNGDNATFGLKYIPGRRQA